MSFSNNCTITDNKSNGATCGCCAAGRGPMLVSLVFFIWVASLNLFSPLWAGIIAGASTVAIGMFAVMPMMMITRHKSRYDLDETCQRLKQTSEELGWMVPAVRNLNESMEKQAVTFGPKVRLVEICKSEYAASVLASDRHLSTLIPCAFGVYQGDDGNVWVSKMNTSLMGKMFGGNVAKIMGSRVAAEEKKILYSVTK